MDTASRPGTGFKRYRSYEKRMPGTIFTSCSEMNRGE
jgi:hypothetical protein